MQTEDQDQPQSFASGEMSDVALVLWEQSERRKEKYKTRYLYLPFQDGAAPSAIGYVSAGLIFALEAPKGKINVRCLPEGAEVLRVVSPSTGVPATFSQAVPAQAVADPVIATLQSRIQTLEKQAQESRQEPATVAVYLHEVAPIVNAIIEYYGREGAVEITTLGGMDKVVFEKHRINELLFGPEGERPTTAATIREQMNMILARTSASTSEAARILNGCANEILNSVDVCEKFCVETMRVRHLDIEDENNSDPKRYSKRDLRALDFAGLARREDQKRMTLDLQEQSMRALPAMFNMLAEQNARWEKLFDRLVDRLDNLASPKKKGGEQQ